jgi:hypothetical protein
VVTAGRDKALYDLEAAVCRVRNAAECIFGDNKSILIEFESIKTTRAAKSKPKEKV